jgi:predicted DNA-binding transcriptional regulator AlpA
MGMVGVWRVLGVSDPTVWRWYQQGVMPPRDFVTGAGRPRWLPATIDGWVVATEVSDVWGPNRGV